MISYREMYEWSSAQAIDQQPAEIHGLMSGWLCAGAAWDAEGRSSALEDWLGVSLSASDVAFMEQLYNEIAEGITDEEFGFALLLPEDDEEVNERTRQVAAWCTGFLYGFGMTGKFSAEDLSEDVAEALTDLGKIAALSEDVPSDEENEADLIEITEYVRMSAILIHAECLQKAVH